MGQLVFMAVCLLVPGFVDWIDRMNEAGGANEAGRVNERGGGSDRTSQGE